MPRKFRNRSEAGRLLALMLRRYANRADVLVLALPRGGAAVACEVAKSLSVPMDIFVVRKLGLPGQEWLAMGAIASGGVRVLNREVMRSLRVPREVIDAVAEREQEELSRQERLYREGRPALVVTGRTVILVDDGLATGSTMRAAAAALRSLRPARLVVAVPIAAPQTCEEFRAEVDEIVCGVTPDPFYSVGLSYEEFTPVTDDEVRHLLRESVGVGAPRRVA